MKKNKKQPLEVPPIETLEKELVSFIMNAKGRNPNAF